MTASGTPTPPIELPVAPDAITDRLHTTRVDVPDTVARRLGDVCDEIHVDAESRAESARDWWPLSTIWALDGAVPARAALVARPGDAAQVAAVLAVCHDARIPVTPAAGRSGVCGASIPVHGGVLLDLTRLSGIVDVDDASLVLDVRSGTFGTWLEDTLRAEYSVTVGHWPQSMDLSTVGGWIACRGAGQLSTRYGKIEDIVTGLDVALADGTTIRTGGAPRAAVGPDLTQIFVGCEGTLGVVTGARLRLHPAPVTERRAAFAFGSFVDGLDACRVILRRGGTPAVLRLYDAIESDRHFATGPNRHVLLVADEGDPVATDAMLTIATEVSVEAGAEVLDAALVETWTGKRNDVAALEALIRRGFVVDTMEIAGRWAVLPAIYESTVAAITSVPGTLVASAHQSHAYSDGACLYFTFAGQPGEDARDAYYRDVWDAGTRAVLDHGGALSHHHGVGLNRARYVRTALGPAFEVLATMKRALDPHGILNPGKLGLDDPFAPEGAGPAWP